MTSRLRVLGLIALISGVLATVAVPLGLSTAVGPLVLAALASLALAASNHPVLRSVAFTLWVFAFVAASMFYPQAFLKWGDFDLGRLIVPLIQIIMFGMGTTLSLADFARVLQRPYAVCIGISLQFLIMPLVGLSLARAFGFEGAIAAGVILIGCCPSGVASNVMAYLGRGDVALSVTVTSCTTLLAPVMTPFLMSQLAGAYVQVELLRMMVEITNMILVPIIAGLLAHRLVFGTESWLGRIGPLAGLAAATLALALAVAGAVPASTLTVAKVSLKGGLVLGAVLLAVVVLAKLLIRVVLRGPENWMDRTLPVLSMLAICSIIAVITARSRDDLLRVGPLLFAAVLIHNGLGYALGYTCARLARLEERACRTVAFEVGMQNGGMASALALQVLKSAPAALAAAIFGPWQNISGSILASWWHRRPPAARPLPPPPEPGRAQ